MPGIVGEKIKIMNLTHESIEQMEEIKIMNLTLESIEQMEDPIACITSTAEETAAFTVSTSACKFF